MVTAIQLPNHQIPKTQEGLGLQENEADRRRENILDLPVKAMQPVNASAGRIALQKSWEIILLLNLVLVFVQRS